MKNINLEPINYYFLKIVLYLMISIFIFLHNSKIIFSNDLNKNINNLKTPEQELATKYYDAINKNIFNGLIKEESLKYEYYFSSLKNPQEKNINFFKKILSQK